MKTLARALILTWAFSGLATTALAVSPMAPIEVKLSQPDGTVFAAYPRGSGYAAWMETAGGHTVLKNNGAWYYARVGPDGALEATKDLVGSLAPAQLDALPKHLHPPVDTSTLTVWAPRVIPHDHGLALATNQPTLTILIDFTDISIIYSDESFRELIYGATGSLKTYYAENSYGAFSVTAAPESYGTADDGIIHVQLENAHPNCGTNCYAASVQLFKNAVVAADPYVNYAAFDSNANGTIEGSELAIIIVVAGYEISYGGAAALTPNINAIARILFGADQVTCDGKILRAGCLIGERHATSVENMHQATLGPFAHEIGHVTLGLLDLYDTDGSSAGIGKWGLMGLGSWATASGWSGSSPSHLLGWDKAKAGFATPDAIFAPTSGVLVNPTDSSPSLKRIWVDKYKFGESFFLESRRLSNFDAGLPGPGLLITHCDDRVVTWNRDETHKLVDIEEADGLNDLDTWVNWGNATDPWPALPSATSFDDASTPNTRTYGLGASGVAVSGISSAGGGTMSADVTPPATAFGEHIGYDKRYTGSGRRGCASTSYTTMWTGLRVLNTTSMTALDGVDVALPGASTVDVYYYSSFSAGTPTGLIYSETGFAGVSGWNRLLFSSPQSFPPGQERGIVLKIQGTSVTNPAVYDDLDLPSGRSYADCDGVGTFVANAGDWNQEALLSGPANPPGVPGDIRAGGPPMRASKSGSDISITWSTTACTGAASYSLVYGKGSELPSTYGGTYGLTGAKCNIGPSPYTWSGSPDPADNSSGFYWWVIVADDGVGTEGSWGKNSGPSERTGPGTNGCSGYCSSMNKVIVNTCGSD